MIRVVAGGSAAWNSLSNILLGPLGPAGCCQRERAMQDLPRNIDADLVIEIGRIFDDAPAEAGISVSETIAECRRNTATRMTDEELETLIVRMSGPRGRAVVFDRQAD